MDHPDRADRLARHGRRIRRRLALLERALVTYRDAEHQVSALSSDAAPEGERPTRHNHRDGQWWEVTKEQLRTHLPLPRRIRVSGYPGPAAEPDSAADCSWPDQGFSGSGEGRRLVFV